jgi:hypothetical protein
MTKLSELNKEEKEELHTLKVDYRDNMKLYRKQLLTLNMLHSYILTSILCTYLIYIFKCDTIYNVLVSLKQRVTLIDQA